MQLPAQLQESQTQVQLLQAQVAQLQTEVRELRARLNMHSGNSSLPPSANPPSTPKPPPKPPDEIIDVPLLRACDLPLAHCWSEGAVRTRRVCPLVANPRLVRDAALS